MTTDSFTQPTVFLTIEQALQQAIAHHLAGRLADAERLYQGILKSHPNHPEVNHNLGMLAVQLGKPTEGLPYFKAALEANPGESQCWVSYIDALIQASQFDTARQVLRDGRQKGLNGEAIEALAGRFESPSGSEPSPQEMNAVIALLNDGRLMEAANLAQTMTVRYPLHGVGWKLLVMALKQTGRSADALAPLQKAAALSPDDANVHNLLGNTFYEFGRLSEAEAIYRRAIQIKPNYAEAYSNLGNVLRDLGRPGEAESCCRKALQINPDFAEALNNLGNTLLDLGRPDEAEVCLRRALQIKPDYPEANYNLGPVLFFTGKFSEGWQKYEYRWEASSPRPQRPPTPLPQWIGQNPSPGDRLLVFEEQGFGDKLQFSRYLSLAANRFVSGVSIVVGRPLLTLFRRSFPEVKVLDGLPADQSAWQWQCPLLSLPLAFNTTLETIPKHIPYLVPDPIRATYWKSRIDALDLPAPTRKIGVVWKSGNFKKDAPLRAVTLQQLSPLLNQPGCAWFSLQKEPDLDKTLWVNSGKLIDWADELIDFDETAALLMNLDLVVSVDTAIVHLAGGLGRPTWLFNRHASEWRWMLGREDSPWYPTMRIFTQKTAGDWDEVVNRMIIALCE